MVLLNGLISLALGAMLSASLANAYTIYWFSDSHCKNVVGGVHGGSDASATAAAGLECNAVHGKKAKSYVAVMGRCQMVLHHFGGYRKSGSGSTCHFSTTMATGIDDFACHQLGDEDITGWQLRPHKKDGDCPEGYGRSRRDVDGHDEVHDEEEVPEGFYNATEIVAQIHRRGGPTNIVEERLVKGI